MMKAVAAAEVRAAVGGVGESGGWAVGCTVSGATAAAVLTGGESTANNCMGDRVNHNI